MRRLILLGAGLALLLGYPFLEGRWLETTHTQIALPGLQRPVKVLHLADLHLGLFPNQERLMAIARTAVEEKPDLIFLTGDYVDGHFVFRFASLTAVIAILARAAPTFAVMGNHDGGAWAAIREGDTTNAPVRAQLEQGGAVVLQNRWERVRIASQELLLVGTGDLWSGELEPAAAFAQAPTGLPTIVLTHNPDAKSLLAVHPWHLLLAGHTHGNQVNLPFWDEPWATVHDQRFIAGHHHWNGRQLYVTRGVGGEMGIRFRSRPEISILELVPRS